MNLKTFTTRLSALVLAALLALVPVSAAQDQAAGLGKSRGNASAPVHIIEYASPTCGACKAFHDTFEPIIDQEYVKTGKVRFEMREYMRNEVDLSIAALARCSGKDDTWFSVMTEAFDRQKEVLSAAQAGTVKPVLLSIAQRHGIEDEAALNACVNDMNTRFDLAAISKSAEASKIIATPTLIVNGVQKTKDADFASPDAFRKFLDRTVEAAKKPVKPVKQPAKKR